MRILLVNPPQTIFPGSQLAKGGLPLGLLYVGTMLDKAGYEVQVLDTLLGDVSFQKVEDTIQVGMSLETIRREMEMRKPDIVGITGISSAQIDNATNVAQVAKQVSSVKLVVVGGPHVSVRPRQYLEEVKDVDLVVIGEGEYTMVDIVENYVRGSMGGINGTAFRKDGEVIIAPPRPFISKLDELPFPAYHLVNIEEYLRPGKVRSHGLQFRREIAMITSRGCPYNCVFCSVHLHMGKKWRAHSQEYVVNHVEHVIREYGVEHIHFEDDSVLGNSKRFEEILDILRAKGVRFFWDASNGVRADGLSFSLLKKMKESGMTMLFVGVESGDQWVLDNVIDKHLRLESVIEVAKWCKQLGIKLNASYIIGLPGEKIENMQKTIDFALMLMKRYRVGIFFSLATPFYGTRLYDICQSKGYFTEELTPRVFSEHEQTWGRSVIRTEDFTPEDLTALASKAMAKYSRLALLEYLKTPRYHLRAAWQNRRNATRFLRSLVRF